MHLNSKLLFEKYAIPYIGSNLRVLEIGPDAIPSTYCNMISDSSVIWETLDMYDGFRGTYLSDDEYSFPIQDNFFDIVVSGQVIEHVRKTWVWIKELARVCKKGGHVITIAPISWPYHKAPIDCWRIFPEGLRTLYEEAGLLVELCKMETLELGNQKLIFPGKTDKSLCLNGEVSIKTLAKRIGFYGRRLIGWPIFCAFDTIAIGMKV